MPPPEEERSPPPAQTPPAEYLRSPRPAPEVSFRQPIDRLTAIRGILASNDHAAQAAYQMNTLVQMGWWGQERDAPHLRQQLESAVRELHQAARRLSSAAYMIQSQKEDV